MSMIRRIVPMTLHFKGISRRAFSTNPQAIVDLFRRIESGDLKAADAETLLSKGPTPDESLHSFANLDHSRTDRTGFPEAVFAAGKTPQQVAAILEDMAKNVNQSKDASVAGTAILATRVTPEDYDQISKHTFEQGKLTYHETAKIISMQATSISGDSAFPEPNLQMPRIVVACAGTTDLPVAEEAAVTLEAAGCEVDRIYDAGVAGLHRIVRAIPRLQDESVGAVIVCAGMDGALPSVVGGLVSVPVVACPTSIGYGAAFGGVSALLTMLNSCSPGVGVVNIDNGFGAAALAYKSIHNKKR